MCVIASRLKSSLRVDAYRIVVRRPSSRCAAFARRLSATRIGGRPSSRSAVGRRRDRSTRARSIDAFAIDSIAISRNRRSIDRDRARFRDRSPLREGGLRRRRARAAHDVVRVGDVCARDDVRARRDDARAREDAGDDDGRARDDRARRRGAGTRARDARGRTPRRRVSARDGDDGRGRARASDARRRARRQSGDDARGGGRGGGAGGRR